MKYLFFDIDGTILSHDEGVPLSVIKGIQQLRENGHKVFICTGRSYAEIPTNFYKIGFDGIVAAAGSYVRIGEEVLFNKVMSENMIDKIIDVLSVKDVPYVLEGVDFAYSHKDAIAFSLIRDEKQRLKKLETNYEHSAYDYRIQRSNSIADYYNNRTPINKMTLLGNSLDDYKELEEVLEDDFYLIKYEKFAELVATGINKFTGIQKVLEYFDAKVEDTFGFGDSMNDYDMLIHCNTGVAMGGAIDKLKEVSDYVTDTVEEDGIYNALKHFDLI